MNAIRHYPDLGDLVMPLISVLAKADLSWVQREVICSAIRACERQWDEMEAERHHFEQSACMGQQQL